MPKKLLLRLLLPALLVGAAILVWMVWSRSAGDAPQAALPEGSAAVLLALAAVAALRSFLEDALDLPLAVWAGLALATVIAVVFLYSAVAGAISLLAVLALLAAFYLG